MKIRTLIVAALALGVATPFSAHAQAPVAACGGNGINHDGSAGQNAIGWAVLEATRFGP